MDIVLLANEGVGGIQGCRLALAEEIRVGWSDGVLKDRKFSVCVKTGYCVGTFIALSSLDVYLQEFHGHRLKSIYKLSDRHEFREEYILQSICGVILIVLKTCNGGLFSFLPRFGRD